MHCQLWLKYMAGPMCSLHALFSSKSKHLGSFICETYWTHRTLLGNTPALASDVDFYSNKVSSDVVSLDRVSPYPHDKLILERTEAG